MNIIIFVFWWTYVCISVGFIPRSGIAGSYYSLILIDIIRANNNYKNSFMEYKEDSHFSSLGWMNIYRTLMSSRIY